MATRGSHDDTEGEANGETAETENLKPLAGKNSNHHRTLSLKQVRLLREG